MRRRDRLRRVEQGLTRVSRIAQGREAARVRAERSGVHLPRPAVNMLAALAAHGPMRLSELSRRTDLEPSLISREIRALVAAGYAERRVDPTDGRAGIACLTARGRAAYRAYRRAVDEIITETFTQWSDGDLDRLGSYVERVVADFAAGPSPFPSTSPASPATLRGRKRPGRT